MSIFYTESSYKNSIIELFKNNLGYEYIYAPEFGARLYRSALR